MNRSSLHRSRKKKHSDRHERVSADTVPASPFFLVRSSAIGFGITVVVGLLFLLIATFAAHASSDPGALAFPLACAALYATAFFAGIITVRIHGQSARICGLIAGGLLLLTGLFLAACLPQNATSGSIPPLLIRFPIPLLSVAGAWIARKRGKSHRYGHR